MAKISIEISIMPGSGNSKQCPTCGAINGIACGCQLVTPDVRYSAEISDSEAIEILYSVLPMKLPPATAVPTPVSKTQAWPPIQHALLSLLEEGYSAGVYQKIESIKRVRELTGMGLKNAKDLVEGWLQPFRPK
jgi:hypothetical protein